MLQKLLDEIRAGRILEPGILAARLGTTPQMVAMMLEDLERMGKLEALKACDSKGCQACDLAGLCAHEQGRQRVWQLKKS
jgi:hypothetical protein